MPSARAAGFPISLFLAVLATSAGAADGSLTVTVRDNYGVIPRASVRATDVVTGKGERAVTDDAGVARFAALHAGQYEVRATFPGFGDAAEPSVSLAEGEARNLELVMGVAQLSTSLTVETANRREQLLLDVAEPVTLIENTRSQDTGARSAKDVLVEQNGSGIQVNAGGGQGYVSINGIPNKGVLVLVNGRRYLGKDANGNLNLEELRLPGIQRIEVVKGAGSALYGSDALGGVVNFITGESSERGLTNSTPFPPVLRRLPMDDALSWRGGRGGVNLAAADRPTTASISSPVRRSCRRPRVPANPQTIGQPPSTYWSASVRRLELSPKVVARFFGDYQLREVRDYFSGDPGSPRPSTTRSAT